MIKKRWFAAMLLQLIAVVQVSGRNMEVRRSVRLSRKVDKWKTSMIFFLFLSFRLTAGKIAGAGLLFVGGGVGGTIMYAKWDSHFRESVEKTIPYSDKLFEMVLGPAPYTVPLPKKPVRI